MANKRISDLTSAGDPPYASGTLLELSIPTGGTPAYASRKATLDNIAIATARVTRTKTSDYALLTSDSGVHFNNVGASADVSLLLPPADVDLTYTIVVHVAHSLGFACTSGDIIKGGTTFSDTTISSNEPYSVLTVECHVAGIWVVTATVGNWS